MKNTVLTKEERAVLVLTSASTKGRSYSNREIAQLLGVSPNRVNTLIHRACVKLGAHNKNKAVNLALSRGDITLTDLWSLDEITELFSSLGPDMLRRIANVVRQGLDYDHLLKKSKQIIIIGRRQDSILTNRERDVIILAGLGLTNKEIADRLYMATGSVRIFMSRACTKLGVSKRSEAMLSALKQREISLTEVYRLNKVVKFLAPLGAESIEKMAQIMEQKFRQGPIDVPPKT